MLWQTQRSLYDAQGIQAWSRGNVPQSITTSPYIARAYARVVLGYLRDVSAELDRSQPVYILELGAGSGRFGFRFVKVLSRLLEGSSLKDLPFTYVMSDISPKLIEFWQTHASLRPLIDSGRLDFAYFDANQLRDITLQNSGATLRDGNLANPLVIVGNYFFDSIPHDSFSIQEHQLFENLVSVVSDTPDLSLGEEQNLTDLRVTFEAAPAAAEYYPENGLNRVLEDYRQRLDDVIFLFPVAGMACVRHFQGVSGNRALFLIGDIGSARESDMREYTSGGISGDNNFWLAVNFHALGEYVKALGGRVLHPPNRHANLNISALVLGEATSDFRETALAYDEAIARLGPDDFFVLSTVISTRFESMKRGELLAFLRASGWDSDFFLQCLPFLMDSLNETSWAGRDDVQQAVDETWEMYFPIGDNSDAADLASGFGVLLYTIGEYTQALDYFQRSLVLAGVDHRTIFNIALCLNRLGRLSEAAEWIERTLELNPDNQQAQEMRVALAGADAEAGAKAEAEAEAESREDVRSS
jgi:tetratricopeptide (TPR) repeat protein